MTKEEIIARNKKILEEVARSRIIDVAQKMGLSIGRIGQIVQKAEANGEVDLSAIKLQRKQQGIQSCNEQRIPLSEKYPQVFNKEYLHQQYEIKGRSMVDIAKENGCGTQLVRENLLKNNIPPKTPKSWSLGLDKNELIQKYNVEKKSLIQISKDYRCTPLTVWNYMVAYGIPTRSISEGQKLRWAAAKLPDSPIFFRDMRC